MKGKGKGDRSGDVKDCPLQFPDLKPVEHQRLCPTVTTGRSNSSKNDTNTHMHVDSWQYFMSSAFTF